MSQPPPSLLTMVGFSNRMMSSERGQRGGEHPRLGEEAVADRERRLTEQDQQNSDPAAAEHADPGPLPGAGSKRAGAEQPPKP